MGNFGPYSFNVSSILRIKALTPGGADLCIGIGVEDVDTEDNVVYRICIVVKAQRQGAALRQRQQLQM